MKAKRILAILLAVMLVLTLVSCGGKGSNGKGSVYWLNFKPELDETLQSLALKYKEKKGVDVKIYTAAEGTYEKTLSSEMEKSNPPTLFVIGNRQGVKDWSDSAMDLKDTAIASEMATSQYSLYDESGKLVSIGYCYECFGIIVNPDLLSKAGHKVEDIKNYETLKTVVEDIHNRAGELGFDAFSSTDMDDSSSWRITAHLANVEYFYEERDAGGWTECPSSLTGNYMPYFKNLYDLIINNSLTAPADLADGGHDAEKEFKDGKAAFFLNGSWEYSKVKDDVPNAVMIPYYCGIEGEEKAGLNCGTENCWAVNSKVSDLDQKATIDFMIWLVTDPEASAAMVDELGIMPFKKAARTQNGFLKTAADYVDKNYYTMDWAFNYQPNSPEYRAALVSAFNAYNKDQSDANWDAVKVAFVDGWAKQYANAN